MERLWNKGLRVLLSASLVMGLVPTSALAEGMDALDGSQEDLLVIEQVEGEQGIVEEGAPDAGEDLSTEVPVVDEQSQPTAQEEPATPEEQVTSEEPATPEEQTATDEQGAAEVIEGELPADETPTEEASTADAQDQTVEMPEQEAAPTAESEAPAATEAPAADQKPADAAAQPEAAEEAPVMTAQAQDISNYWLTMNTQYAYTGKPVVINSWVSMGPGQELKQGTDYTLSFFRYDASGKEVALKTAPSAVGEYYVRAIGVSSKGYTGQTRAYSFSIVDGTDLSNASLFLEDSVFYLGGKQTYLYKGSAIKPKISVMTNFGGEYRTLVSGTDYAVRYANNTAPTQDGNLATVTVTGKGSYHGTLTATFQIVSKVDFQDYARLSTVNLHYAGETYTYNTTVLSTGSPVAFAVSFDNATLNAVEGKDFTVSYEDADGNAISAPSQAGSYYVVLTATEGGFLSGEYRVSFSLVENKSLDGATVYPDYQLKYHTVQGDDYCLYDVLGVDSIDDIDWRLVMGPGPSATLSEGVDYRVNAQLVDESVAGPNTYIVTLEGIGSYTGTATLYKQGKANAYVRISPDKAALFANIDAQVNGSSRTVSVDAAGKLQEPKVVMLGLDSDDYRFSHFEDSNGKTVVTASEGDTITVVIEGLGQYAGGVKKTDARVAVAEVPSLSNTNSVAIMIRNAWEAFTNGSMVTYLLKGAEPDVALKVYSNYTVLDEGQGFSVLKTLASDGNSMTITASSTDSSLLKGTASRTVQLVDAYDLGLVRLSYRLLGPDNVSGEPYYSFRVGPAQLAYPGFAFTPQVVFETSLHEGPDLTFDQTLKDASGNTVSQITGPGEYTIVLKGTGNWTGTKELPINVYDAGGKIGVNKCGISLGSARLVNGQARPSVTLTYGSHTFVEGTDYTVEYGNNTKVGANGWVKIVATANSSYLSGGKTVRFTVLSSEADLSQGYRVIIPQVDETGLQPKVFNRGIVKAGTKPAVKVVDASGAELDASYYTVEYGTEANGKGSVMVAGANGYTGLLTRSYPVRAFSNKTSLAPAKVTGVKKTYTGKALTTTVTVKLGTKTLKSGTDYTVKYSNNVKAGKATITVTGKGNYVGVAKGTFVIAKAAQKITASNKNMQAKKTVSLGAKASGGGKLTYASSNKAVATVNAKGVVTGKKLGKVTITIKAAATANYNAAKRTVTVYVKNANTLGAKAAKASVIASFTTLKSKNVVLARNITVSKPVGTVTYAKASGAAAFTVNKTTGKVTVKKGTKKGTYTLKVRVTAAGNSKYLAKSINVTYKIVVK